MTAARWAGKRGRRGARWAAKRGERDVGSRAGRRRSRGDRRCDRLRARGRRRRRRVGASRPAQGHSSSAQASRRIAVTAQPDGRAHGGDRARDRRRDRHRGDRALPAPAFAWTPGTHVFLGEAVLRSLALLPPARRRAARARSRTISCTGRSPPTRASRRSTRPAGRHCHAWNVGTRDPRAARDEPLHAFALGYLAHLAADAVAHNYFVPRQLAITSSTSALGHSYWESRFETHLGERYARRARELILLDHARSDAHLDRILSPTIFSTPTNRRIFRGMVYVTDTESWQRDLPAHVGEEPLGPAGRGRRRVPRRGRSTSSMDFLRRDRAVGAVHAGPVGRRRRCGWRNACGARRCATGWRGARRDGGRPALRDAGDRRCGSPSDAAAAALPAGARRQQLIHLLRVGAPAGLLHHRADEHARAASSRPRR